jgi:hypothetical protein
MNYPSQWNELLRDQNAVDVYVARAFRPINGDFTQFTDSTGGEHVAVRSLTPYGEAASLEPSLAAALLATEAQGQDYTVLRIPSGTLTVRQASFGNSKSHALDLKDTYRRLGRLAGHLTEKVASPTLSLADFGVNKRTGDLVLLPPLDLGHGTHDQHAQVEGIAASIDRTFKSLLPQSVSLELIDEVRSGFGENQ